MDNVKNKTAFVTGGASGIGLGMARSFVRAGMNVVMADIRQDHLQAALQAFAESGQASQVMGLQLDVTDRQAYAAAAEVAQSRFGAVHLLCNNAGMGLIGPIKLAGFSDWDWGLSVMLGGVVNGIQIFLPHFLRHGEGAHIVNTSSMAAVVPIPNASIYCTVKAALIGMSESLRGELAKDGIGVSAFCPGPVQSNIRETGKTRPDQFKQQSGYGALEKSLEDRPNSPLWMTADDCGDRVLRGVQRNDLYIFTHREFKEGTAERCARMLASFPDEPRNEARAQEIAFLLKNPIFAA